MCIRDRDYLDSLSNEKVWLGNWTLKQCREMEISLGLDLKGGMNVILEVSVPDVIKALADNKPDEAFNNALATAAKQAINSQDDVITLFVKEYHRIAPDAKLSELFATQQLKDKVSQKSTDAEVEKVLREEVKAAVENSFNVLRTRIDRFGVVQPNIQSPVSYTHLDVYKRQTLATLADRAIRNTFTASFSSRKILKSW